MTGNPYHDENGRFCSKEEMGQAVERIFTAATAADTEAERGELMQQWFALKSEYDAASGAEASSGPELADDIVATIKKRNRGKPLAEQLEAIKAARAELAQQDEPLKAAQKKLYDEQEKLTSKYWKAAEPRDYIGLNDYAGMQALMRDAFSNSAANEYMKTYLEKLNPHLRPNGYQPAFMIPALDVMAPYGLKQEEVEGLASALGNWASFVLSNRSAAKGEDAGSYLDAYAKMRLEEEARSGAYENVQIFDHRGSEDGIRSLRVYEDGTATPVMTVRGSLYGVDMTEGTSSYTPLNSKSAHAARKPLPEVLAEINKVWYYPESSNPNAEDEDEREARLYGRYGNGDYDDDDY